MIKISQDNNYVTVEIFDAAMNEIRTEFKEIRAELKEIRAEVRAIERTVDKNTVRIDELKNFSGLGFTLLSGVIAFVGCVVTLAPSLLEYFKYKREQKKNDALTPEKVQRMIDASMKKNS